jgi:SAM-dependent methyltransferase
MDYRAIYEYYWMRPENALWRARDFQVMEKVVFKGRSLDFGAGDGAISFLRAGGRLVPHYDAFSESLDTSRFFKGEDIYDQFHDVSGEIVANPANYRINVAFDLKKNLLAKARKMYLYDEIVVGDGNECLPFEDEEFQTIFSNIVYWLKDPVKTMSELSRITQKSGQIILFLPSDHLADYSFYNKYFLEKGKPTSREFLSMLDMGRLANNIKISKSAPQWEAIFEGAGLDVITRVQHISGAMVRLWDVGLRPFSPFMIQMANRLSPEERADAKNRWVEETYGLFEGFLNLQPELEQEEPTAFFCYVLGKR